MAILGIDPGTMKCGYAVTDGAGAAPLDLGIVPTAGLQTRIAEIVARYGPSAIALGAGTHAAAIRSVLAAFDVPVTLVDERDTTLLARRRYFAVHPPRGLLRLVPRGMLLPPRPIDDFAALLIAERYLAIIAP